MGWSCAVPGCASAVGAPLNLWRGEGRKRAHLVERLAPGRAGVAIAQLHRRGPVPDGRRRLQRTCAVRPSRSASAGSAPRRCGRRFPPRSMRWQGRCCTATARGSARAATRRMTVSTAPVTPPEGRGSVGGGSRAGPHILRLTFSGRAWIARQKPPCAGYVLPGALRGRMNHCRRWFWPLGRTFAAPPRAVCGPVRSGPAVKMATGRGDAECPGMCVARWWPHARPPPSSLR